MQGDTQGRHMEDAACVVDVRRRKTEAGKGGMGRERKKQISPWVRDKAMCMLSDSATYITQGRRGGEARREKETLRNRYPFSASLHLCMHVDAPEAVFRTYEQKNHNIARDD